MSKFFKYIMPLRPFFRSKEVPRTITPSSGVSPEEYARTHDTVQVTNHAVTVDMLRRLLREDGKALSHNPVAMQVITRYQQFLSHINPDGTPGIPPERRETFRGWVNTVSDGQMAKRRQSRQNRGFDKKQRRNQRYD